ncbi:hypothetical protein NITHO_4060004 [Nitrolancea hollandica Lb]|uniref:Uncharacterized protein n=1 Tax=Nitrolancea hollandica Lb TaxID=1129897 RepID=I4EJI8_9BACT|nr:hypothetical protein NITHO_4060004 [Nitrolancea hollandica Lb]
MNTGRASWQRCVVPDRHQARFRPHTSGSSLRPLAGDGRGFVDPILNLVERRRLTSQPPLFVGRLQIGLEVRGLPMLQILDRIDTAFLEEQGYIGVDPSQSHQPGTVDAIRELPGGDTELAGQDTPLRRAARLRQKLIDGGDFDGSEFLLEFRVYALHVGKPACHGPSFPLIGQRPREGDPSVVPQSPSQRPLFKIIKGVWLVSYSPH